jgi:hypothetical protein
MKNVCRKGKRTDSIEKDKKYTLPKCASQEATVLKKIQRKSNRIFTASSMAGTTLRDLK